MRRQAAARDLGFDRLTRPQRQRVQLETAVENFERGQRGAQRRLIALAARDPDVETGKGARERLDLAHEAARIGIAQPQRAGRVNGGKARGVGHDRAHIAQAEPGDQVVAVAQRLAEQLARVDEDHGNRGIDLGDEGEQERRLGAKGRDQGDAGGLGRTEKDAKQRLAREMGVPHGERSEVRPIGGGDLRGHRRHPGTAIHPRLRPPEKESAATAIPREPVSYFFSVYMICLSAQEC